MRDDSPAIGVPNPGEPPEFRETSGEILVDGTVIDLMIEGNKLVLCRWDGRKLLLVPYLSHSGFLYRPPKLAVSLRQALRFPAAPVEFGALRSLFDDVTAV